MSQLDEDIREDYAKHNSLFKTARRYDVEVGYVLNLVQNDVQEVAPDLTTCEFDGFGDPVKKKYLIARNAANTSWDNTAPEIVIARAKFEAGTHTMAIGRDGPYLLMYCFPLAVKRPKPGYFQPTVEA